METWASPDENHPSKDRQSFDRGSLPLKTNAVHRECELALSDKDKPIISKLREAVVKH